MQTSTHTPMRHTEGPWHIEDHHILGGTPQERIAFEVNHIGNARLIAASPALLDALTRIARVPCARNNAMTCLDVVGMTAPCVGCIARQAVKLAE